MGMDVYGKSPKKKSGEYFRNNVWWWRPLWNYCRVLHPDIAGKVVDGHSNSGDGLEAEDALKLGLLLKQDIETGVTKKYSEDYEKYINSLPLETCSLCEGKGKITADALTNLVDDILSSSHNQERHCGRCDGSGKSEPWIKSYPFSVDNVQEFADFCINSGGFSIC